MSVEPKKQNGTSDDGLIIQIFLPITNHEIPMRGKKLWPLKASFQRKKL